MENLDIIMWDMVAEKIDMLLQEQDGDKTYAIKKIEYVLEKHKKERVKIDKLRNKIIKRLLKKGDKL